MTRPRPPAERERLGELFERAVRLPDDERDAFLKEACGDDPALRDELDSLLAADAAAPGYLEDLAERGLPAALLGLSQGARHGERIAGRYEILERLGEGGMGVVYKAMDLSLRRPVALKFLAPGLASDAESRSRLLTEARAASALDHPNIAVVHEIGRIGPSRQDPEGGRLFVVMAYYAGETLKARLARGRLDIPEAMDVGIQLAEGLSSAHEAGIVHRDVKPANVMITREGRVKILDFGVAKVAGGGLTREGARVGTAAYMSPEQTRGDLVDSRSDLWSLGVVLYEMLTGARPFRGEVEDAVVFGIRHHDPPRLETLRPDVAPELARVVHRCLARDPAARYGSAESLLADLRALAPASGLTGAPAVEARPGIVVLPFVNLSPDPANEFFSDGLTEEVITDLSGIGALRVISRTSSMRLKGSARDVRDVAREVGVRYVLEGGVRKAGDVLRITVQLVDAHADGHLWAGKFDGTMADVFEIQEKVAGAIVAALRIRLSPAEERALADRPIPDVQAYESFLRARYEAWRFSRAGLTRAERYIEAALGIAGDNELLYSTLGHIRAMYLESGLDPDPTALERVAELAEKAFNLNPHSARGHWLKAFVAFQRGDPEEAIRGGSRALTLASDDPDTLLLLGYVYANVGRTLEARALLDRAVELDPLTPLTQCMPGFVDVMEGRFSDAVEPYRRLYEMDPDSPFAAATFGWALTYARRFDEALGVLVPAAGRFQGTAFGSWAGSFAHSLRGEPDQALAAITPAMEAAARTSSMFARELAHCHALAGSNDQALEWLEHAVQLGMRNYPFLAEHDWLLDGLRGDPRFGALLERVRAATARLSR